MRRRCLALLCLLAPLTLPAADPGKQLLDAAAQGHVNIVQDLLAKGVRVEIKDKNGRTPLMLAAQRGHVEVVRLLLSKGAEPWARDSTGATPWVLATFSPAGDRAGNAEVLKALPPPDRPKWAVEALWSGANVYNSCVMAIDLLSRYLNQLRPDQLALSAFRRYLAESGKDLVEEGDANARGGGAPSEEAYAHADAVLILSVRPGVACEAQQSADHLTLTIDARLVRSSDRAVVFHKTVGGGGIKSLHQRLVTGQAQYLPVFQEWMQPDAEQIYWAAVESWYRAE
jgi:hypothetical protein